MPSHTPRIRELLDALESAKIDLLEAETAERAACAREDIAHLQHSLWLAGYEPEEVA